MHKTWESKPLISTVFDSYMSIAILPDYLLTALNKTYFWYALQVLKQMALFRQYISLPAIVHTTPGPIYT